jgi:hypothetical protein
LTQALDGARLFAIWIRDPLNDCAETGNQAMHLSREMRRFEMEDLSSR